MPTSKTIIRANSASQPPQDGSPRSSRPAEAGLYPYESRRQRTRQETQVDIWTVMGVPGIRSKKTGIERERF